MAVTWGLDPKARAISVYYEGSDTIYEGSALCYNWDTTENWMGVSSADLDVETDTTAEGYQNEGKFIRVEKPATANLAHLAGFVVGNASGFTGPGRVDIYVPNGAIVPVRTDLNCVVGTTVLGLVDADYDLSGGGHPVAIAQETVDRSGTEGIVLARVCPDEFVYSVGTFRELTGSIAHKMQSIFENTSGSSVGLFVHSTMSGILAASHNEWGILDYVDISGSITAAGYTRALLAQLNLSGTINHAGSHQYAIMAQLSGSPTFTANQRCAGLAVDCSLGVVPTSGVYNAIQIANNGANQTEVHHGIELWGNYGINYLFSFQSCDGITGNFISNGGTGGAEIGITSGGNWKKVKCNLGGTDYFLILMVDPTEVDMVT